MNMKTMLKNIRIENARREDLKECVKIMHIPELQLTEGTYIDEKLLQKLLCKDFFLVARDEKSIVGCLVSEPIISGAWAYIWFFAVRKDLRGNGIGKMLLSDFEKRMKRRKKGGIFFTAPTESRKAVQFYKKANYIPGKKVIEMVKVL